MRKACLILAPHPDDETIGAGIWMDRNRDHAITILHITDGSPRDLGDARAAGFQSRQAYGDARRQELENALRYVQGNIELRRFDYVDKESFLHLPELVERLAALIEDFQPSLVLCPSYEGGHPDHDAAALALAAARVRVGIPFQGREFPLYHSGPEGQMITGEFLGREDVAVEVCALSPAEQEKKRTMLASFTSQQKILSRFTVMHESFRDVPDYDFSRPPHDGMLLYERWGMGVSAEDWLRHARRVLGLRSARGKTC